MKNDKFDLKIFTCTISGVRSTPHNLRAGEVTTLAFDETGERIKAIFLWKKWRGWRRLKLSVLVDDAGEAAIRRAKAL